MIVNHHAIPSGMHLIAPSFILQYMNVPKHTATVITNYLQWQYIDTESCNRWTGPHRALISTSSSLPGITWGDRRHWDRLNPQEICGESSTIIYARFKDKVNIVGFFNLMKHTGDQTHMKISLTIDFHAQNDLSLVWAYFEAWAAPANSYDHSEQF